MRLAIDTNAYGDAVRGDPARVQTFKTASELFLPVIVLGELHAGFRGGRKRGKNEAILKRFLNSNRVHVLPVDEETALYDAQINQTLRQQGTPIPTNDIWIAAIVLQHGLVLCTSDAHFRHVPHLPTC